MLGVLGVAFARNQVQPIIYHEPLKLLDKESTT